MLQVVNGTSWWIVKDMMINWEMLKTKCLMMNGLNLSSSK